jgi:probable FeS assembly SUF system protein SufT
MVVSAPESANPWSCLGNCQNRHPDGGGLTNQQEHLGGADSQDYYKNNVPTIEIGSGNNQWSITNTALGFPPRGRGHRQHRRLAFEWAGDSHHQLRREPVHPNAGVPNRLRSARLSLSMLSNPGEFMSTVIQQYDDVTFSRDTQAVQIPSGNALTVPKGTTGTVTQTLGGNFTVQVPSLGALVRVMEKDISALLKDGQPVELPGGITVTPATEAASTPSDLSESLVLDRLRTVFDPEIPVNVVDLGLIYDVHIEKLSAGGNKVDVKMTLTAPGCGMGPSIAGDAQMKILGLPGVEEADVQLVWDPPWNPSMISPDGRKRLGIE